VPKCGHVRCKKKLLKKEYECEVPVYECVVKYLCSDCSENGSDCTAESETGPTAAPVPTRRRQALELAPLPPR
jgi:hypothetical protein